MIKTKKSQLLNQKNDGTFDVEDVQVVVKVEKRHFEKGSFFMQTFKLLEIIQDYTKTEIKVLIALQKRLDFNNRIKTFRQIDIANELSTKQPNVSRALKKITEDKIIFQKDLDYYFSDEFIKFAGDKK